ncbi:MarR family winged helix-turn-helix transcriptional regulator [Streptomyces griseorubiginosus]|uniref:MarR family winged helix-turn-helix transcriptional regulator n=1 Tax=Streptomyces griseorubiginosus TaxID=67304 RepID=UPI0036EE6785
MPTPEPRMPTTAEAGPMSYAIFQLSRAHRTVAAALLREMDLHPGQELVPTHLFDRDGQSQSEPIECLGVDHSTISKTACRMQGAGLVVREPAAHDRRVMVVHLTEEQQAESFVETAYAGTEAIGSRALPEEEST